MDRVPSIAMETVLMKLSRFSLTLVTAVWCLVAAEAATQPPSSAVALLTPMVEKAAESIAMGVAGGKP